MSALCVVMVVVADVVVVCVCDAREVVFFYTLANWLVKQFTDARDLAGTARQVVWTRAGAQVMITTRATPRQYSSSMIMHYQIV